MYTTIPKVFIDQYNFSSTQVGLTYLGNGLGATVALYVITYLSDKLVIRYKAKHGVDLAPEIRLLPLLWVGPLVPAGLLWYGCSADEGTHWIVPILGTVFFAAGIVAASVCYVTFSISHLRPFRLQSTAASQFVRRRRVYLIRGVSYDGRIVSAFDRWWDYTVSG
jgi:hypothetical protein